MPIREWGSFGLTPDQRTPFNAFVSLETLQRTLRQGKVINAVFIAAEGVAEEDLRNTIRQAFTLEDLNVQVRLEGETFSLQSPSFFLNPELAEMAGQTARDVGAPLLPISTYLANFAALDGRRMPYSLMAAMDLNQTMSGAVLEQGSLQAGKEGVVLSAWAAEDLQAEVGDSLELTYFGVDEQEALIDETVQLKVTGILAMEGPAVDPTLTPDFPGVGNADNMAEWDPPFPMDMSAIRDKDEEFWDQYRTAPKLFVSRETGKRLWKSRFGFETTLRMGTPPGQSTAEVQALFQQKLLQNSTVESAGFLLAPVKAQGLASSSGATDFSQLFIAFSFFIIMASVLLVGLFFRLMVEQRGTEIGVMTAVGFPLKKIRARFFMEGMALSFVGSVLGLGGGLLYGTLVMAGLRNWWDLGTANLLFHFQATSLIVGFAISVVVAFFSIWHSVRYVGKVPVTVLVAGGSMGMDHSKGRRARRVFWGFAGLTLVLLVVAFLTDAPTGLFFAVGSCLLITGLAFLATRLGDRRVENGISGTMTMAARNMSRQGGRSLVSVSLVACACYVIVAVGLYRHTGEVDPDLIPSGTGGFFLEAETDIPIHYPLGSKDAALALGLDSEAEALLSEAEVVSMRLKGGDDASCLNLFAPQEPRILGISDLNTFKDRFEFQSTLDHDDDPWRVLDMTFQDGAIPVIGDQNSMMWILKLKMGQDLVVKDDNGKDVVLRLAGMVKKSIFQSELIMKESHFLNLYSSQSGYRKFLIASGENNRSEMAPVLERGLAGFGFDAVPTARKIQAFHEVENTYISIFQMLGGLGLLLGTLGLGAIIYRNALERQGEFAAMRAFGYRKSRISRLLLAENAVLMLAGITIGTLAALVSVAPHLIASHADPSVPLLLGTLVGVFVIGLAASFWAVRKTHGFPLLMALRAK